MNPAHVISLVRPREEDRHKNLSEKIQKTSEKKSQLKKRVGKGKEATNQVEGEASVF